MNDTCLTTNIIREACVETLDQCIQAEQCGADRLELCAELETGGLTPSISLIQAVLEKVNIPVMVMIRPRAGDFCYTRQEIEQMEAALAEVKSTGVAGVVFGFLKKDFTVDEALTQRFAALSAPLQVTFHKAVDETPDPVAATECLAGIPGITRILSSGGAETALEGAETLRRMVQAAGSELNIIAAGKVTEYNLEQIRTLTGAREYHGKRIVY
jgi:copper homeostasis protein